MAGTFFQLPGAKGTSGTNQFGVPNGAYGTSNGGYFVPPPPSPLGASYGQPAAGDPSNAPPLPPATGSSGGTPTNPPQGIAGGTGGNGRIPTSYGGATSDGAGQGIAGGQQGNGLVPSAMGGSAPTGSTGAPAAPSSSDPGINQINIPYGANPIYTPAMTAHAVNQAIAANTPDPRWAQKQSMGHGQSLSAGTLGAAIPKMGAQIATGQAQAAQIPFNDYMANQQNMLQGQEIQTGAVNQYQALLNALQGLNNSYDTTTSGNSLGLLQQLLQSAQ